MSIAISPLANSNQFGTWLTKTNQIAAVISSNVVTVDSSTTGSLTSGNAVVNGFFGAANLVVSGNLSGGSLTVPANLAISTNVLVSNSTVTLWSILANSTTTGIAINTNTITLSTNTKISGNGQFLNSVSVGANLTANALNVGANVLVNTSAMFFGNSTVNSTVNSTIFTGQALTANNSTNLGGLAAASYQTTAGLAANVATLTSNNSTNFAGQAQAFYANISSPVHTISVAVGANIVVNTSTLSIGNSTVNTQVNSTFISTGVINASGNLIVGGGLYVTGNIVTTGTSSANGDTIPSLDNTYKLGNSTFRFSNVFTVGLSTNLISIGNSTVVSTVNSTVFTGTSNNSTNFAGQAQAFYANVTSPVITTTLEVGAVGNNVTINTTAVIHGNSTVFSTVNSTIFTGQSLTSNNSTNFSGQGQAYYANATIFTGAFKGTTVNASSTGSFAGLLQANAGLVSTGFDITGGAQVRMISTNYAVLLRNDDTSMFFMQTASANSAGTFNSFRPLQWLLSTGAVTIDGTGVGTTFGGGLTVNGNVYSTTLSIGNSTVNSTVNSTIFSGISLTANNSTNFAGQGQGFYANVTTPLITTTLTVGNSTVNATVNSTVFTGTANNTSFVGATSAANVVSNTQLTANLANYQTTAGLAANVATLTANAATNFGGHIASYYANVTSYPGAFNGTSVSASWGNFSGQVNASAGVVSLGFDNGGSGGQFRLIDSNFGVILRNDDTSFFIMSTATANATGTWNALRPFAYNLTTGAVTIDATGVGTTFGGNVIASNGYIQSQFIKTTSLSDNTTIANTDSDSVLLVANTLTKLITLSNTVPANSRFMITRMGTGNVNISNQAGLTLGSRTGNYNILAQYGSISVFYANTTLAIIDGNI